MVYVSEVRGCGWYVHNGMEDMLDDTPIYMNGDSGLFCQKMKNGYGTYFKTREEAAAAALRHGYVIAEDK
jgi:hypothetical protein